MMRPGPRPVYTIILVLRKCTYCTIRAYFVLFSCIYCVVYPRVPTLGIYKPCSNFNLIAVAIVYLYVY